MLRSMCRSLIRYPGQIQHVIPGVHLDLARSRTARCRSLSTNPVNGTSTPRNKAPWLTTLVAAGFGFTSGILYNYQTPAVNGEGVKPSYATRADMEKVRGTSERRDVPIANAVLGN